MVDIVINGPDGQSTVPNVPEWASEATQKNISKTLSGLGTGIDKIKALLELQIRGFKLDTEASKKGDAEIIKLMETLNKTAKLDEKNNKRAQEINESNKKGLDLLADLQQNGLDQLVNLNRTTSQQNKDLDKILSDLNNSGDGIMSFAGGMGKGLNMFTSVLGVAGKALGAFGTAVLGAVSFITSQFTDTFKFLNNGLKDGTGGIIGLTKSVDNVAMSANLAGMSLDEFGEFAAANSKILRTLSARGFADLYTKSLLASGGLLDMGMTADDAVESVMSELEFRRRFGLVLTAQTTNLQSSLMASARELRIFANAVGMSESDLRAQSEVAENHIDLLQLQAMNMGRNSDEIIRSTQTLSRQLGAAGMEELINPLFEAISKGSTGLSEELIEIGKVAPELLELIEEEAASFGQTGVLNANLGREIFGVMRSLDQVQLDGLEALVIAGDAGAVSLNNLRKNINKLSSEQIQALFGDLDETSLSLLDTFNRFGFIVNQGTAAIGDMGKVAVLSALGFDRAADGTFDFNQGITQMAQNMLDFTGSVFGKNTGIYDAMEEFTQYMQAMFGDSSEEELDEARTKFMDSISGLGQKIGLAINSEIKAGTIGATVSKFFKDMFESIVLGIYDMSGGTLMDSHAHDIMAGRFMRGEIGAAEMSEFAGDISGAERQAVSDALINNRVKEEAKRLGIDYADVEILNQYKPGQFTAGTGIKTRNLVNQMERIAPGISDMYSQYFNNAGTFIGTDEDKESDEYKNLMKQIQDRADMIIKFNTDMQREYNLMTQQLKDEDISVESRSYDRNVLRRANNFIITEDFDEDNTALQNYKLDQIVPMGSTFKGSTMTDAEIKEQQLEASRMVIASQIAQANASGVFDSNYFRAEGGEQPYMRGDVSSRSAIGNIRTTFDRVMADNLLTNEEDKEISNMINQMQSDYGNLGKEDKALLRSLEDLIKVVRKNSNILINNQDSE